MLKLFYKGKDENAVPFVVLQMMYSIQQKGGVVMDAMNGRSIDALNLSVRSTNALKRAGVFLIADLMDLTEESLWNMPNMGAKSVQEVLDVKRTLFGVENAQGTSQVAEEPLVTFIDDLGVEYLDIPIDEIPMTNRARHLLEKAEVKFASQIRTFTYEDFMAMRNAGATTAKQLTEIVENFSFVQVETTEVAIDSNLEAIIDEISVFCDIPVSGVLALVKKIIAQHSGIAGESLIYKIYEQEKIRCAFKNKVLALLKKRDGEIAQSILEEKMPPHLDNTVIFSEILLELEQKKEVRISEGYITSESITILDFVQVLKEKEADMVTRKLQGETLEKIGLDYEVQRERVRQVIEKALAKKPVVNEDKYRYVFSTYLFSKEEFCSAFGVPETTYNYLDLVCKEKDIHKKALMDALEDENLTPKVRRQIEAVVYKNYITVDGRRLLKERATLVRYAASLFARDTIKFKEFFEKYHAWLGELNLDGDPKVVVNSRTYENALTSCDYALHRQNKQFRYYEINNRDYQELLDAIDLEQYEDVVLSAYKFFKELPELMKSYDIRDEYELHNLLKKIMKSPKITFEKMPTIIIGEGNVEKQAEDLLVSCAPILAIDLAGLYEQQYGIKATTALANYFKSLYKYYHDGVYTVEYEHLTPEEFAYMRKLLCDDCYMIKDVVTKYTYAFPEGDSARINSHTLKELGYKVYSHFVIKNTYSSTNEYVRNLLTKDDFVDLNFFTNGIQRTTTFSAILYGLRADFEIVEYAPKQYINIKRLEQVGVTKGVLQEFSESVNLRVPRGEYFTMHSLEKSGFNHPLYDLGFENTFYAALLTEDKQNFSYFRIAGQKVFYKGNKDCSFADFLENLLWQYNQFDIYEFSEFLEQEYGLVIPVPNLIEFIKKTSLYYAPIMNRVYVDYDTYIEEI